MRYYKKNNIHIVEVPIKDFKIVMNDSKKKTAASKNYCNAGYFANYSENGQIFTLPVAHLVCDYNAKSSSTKKYCTERGKFNGNKFTFDSSTWSYCNSFHNKYISTLLIKDDKAEIKNIKSVPSGYNYAVSGIPIMKNGSSVNFENDVQTQGWDSSPLYATWHIFIGLKKDSNTIYVMGMQTATWNMVKTNEAYNKFKTLGMYNVIKLDGGGSFHMNVNGKSLVNTYEDRRVNTIICFDESNNKDDEEDSDDDGKANSINKVTTNESKTNEDKIINNTNTNTNKTTTNSANNIVNKNNTNNIVNKINKVIRNVKKRRFLRTALVRKRK